MLLARVQSRLQVSCDVKGFVKYWDSESGQFPSQAVQFKSIFQTDLMACVKDAVVPKSIAVSKDGQKFALSCSDFTVRVFKYQTGKCIQRFDTSIQVRFQQEGSPAVLHVHG
jgi:peptidylprolyl isomerase domain and WD repeat-containing protein 1